MSSSSNRIFQSENMEGKVCIRFMSSKVCRVTMKSVRSSTIIAWTDGERAMSATVGIRALAGSPQMYSSQISRKTSYRENNNISRSFSIRAVCIAFMSLSIARPLSDHTV